MYTLQYPCLVLHVLPVVHYKMHKTVTKRLDFCSPSTFRVLSQLALEFIQISKAVAIGFAVMGFIGYFVKLIHIPM